MTAAPPAVSLFHSLPRFWRWVIALLCGLAGLALIGQLVVYGHYAVALLRFPFDYDQGEGFELYDTVLHAQGQWPYRDSQIFPFYTSIYPPLFHLLTVPLVWLAGPQLWTGRLVGLAASLVAAGAIGWGVQRATGQRFIAFCSGLTFLASNYTFHIGPLFRQHMTMVAFETLAIVVLANASLDSPAPDKKHRWGLWIGLLLLLAAGFTKQMALATVLAALAFLWVRGPLRARLAGVGLVVIATGLFLGLNHASGYSATVPPLEIFQGPLAPLNQITSSWWFISLIRANVNQYDFNQALSFYRQWGELHRIIAGLALGRLVYEIYWARLSAYAWWFALALATGVLTGKFGAGESYFVTATAAACVLSGIACARLWQWAARRARWGTVLAGVLIPLLYLAQTRLTLHMYTDGPVYTPIARALGVWTETGYYDSQGYTQLGPRPKLSDHTAGWEITALARNAPGPVFSEEAAFMFRAGKPVVTNPFPQLVMYQAGLFDPTEEIRMINQKQFGLIIFRAQFYPPPVLQAIGANYQPSTEIHMNGFTYRILTPRP